MIQAIDPDANVTLNSGAGTLLVTGFVEAGNALSLIGADDLSPIEVSVVIDKLFYETKTLTFPTIFESTLGEAEFVVDELSRERLSTTCLSAPRSRVRIVT